MKTFYQLVRCQRATAAVEAAIFLPIFMLLTFGIVDLGQAMFMRQQVNAAAQAGATYAIVNTADGLPCHTTTPGMPGGCLSGIQATMNAAVGSSFCSVPGACPATFDVCPGTAATPPTQCITVTANYSLIPILPSVTYAWAQAMTISYTVTIRIS